MTRSSAISLLPMPDLPSRRMPTPKTSISTPCRLADSVSASSRKAVTCWMKVELSSGVFISASWDALQASTSELRNGRDPW